MKKSAMHHASCFMFHVSCLMLSSAFAADLAWTDASTLPLYGKGFEGGKHYCRLPEPVKEKVTNKKVKLMADDCTGLYVEFKTDANKLNFEWTLANPDRSDANISPTGCQGLDIYAGDGAGNWRFVSTGRVRMADKQNPVRTKENLKWDTNKICRVYLPYRGQVDSLKIGVKEGKKVEAYEEKLPRVVHYGTSVVHGGCVDRAGLLFTSIYGRLAGVEVINLGFSGSAKLEPELPELWASIPAELYVVDSALNNHPPEIEKNLEPFVRELAKLVGSKPILIPEPVSTFEKETDRSLATRKVYEKLKADGFNVHTIRTDELIADDSEGTVDGTHPNAYGAMQMGRAFAKKVREILGK